MNKDGIRIRKGKPIGANSIKHAVYQRNMWPVLHYVLSKEKKNQSVELICFMLYISSKAFSTYCCMCIMWEENRGKKRQTNVQAEIECIPEHI